MQRINIFHSHKDHAAWTTITGKRRKVQLHVVAYETHVARIVVPKWTVRELLTKTEEVTIKLFCRYGTGYMQNGYRKFKHAGTLLSSRNSARHLCDNDSN